MLASSVDQDQMPHYVASDLGLHCLPRTLVLLWDVCLAKSDFVRMWPQIPLLNHQVCYPEITWDLKNRIFEIGIIG